MSGKRLQPRLAKLDCMQFGVRCVASHVDRPQFPPLRGGNCVRSTLAEGASHPQTPEDFYSVPSQKMKTDSENRTAWKTVRFTDAEAAEVDQHADACGLSASELIRRRVLGQRLPKGSAPELNLLAWRELAHLAANVNQLLKHLNEQRTGIGRAIVDLLQVKALVIKVDAAIQKVRLQLLGADTE